MARITIEDCMEKVPNRFHLVRMASIRAKQLKKGARPLLVSDENKHVVMALREIAAGLVKPGDAVAPPEPDSAILDIPAPPEAGVEAASPSFETTDQPAEPTAEAIDEDPAATES